MPSKTKVSFGNPKGGPLVISRGPYIGVKITRVTPNYVQPFIGVLINSIYQLVLGGSSHLASSLK